jgi:hypothetical protein
MGLFDRKYCDICGGKIGVLGNRRLSDGNLCKDCAALLSPWFTERRASTVEDIRSHLAYREANREAAAYFRASRTFGSGTKLYIDEGAGSFAVTSAKDPAADHADIIGLASLTDCAVDIRETRSELRRKGPDGKTVRYDPPRWEYAYDFDVVLSVDHPWISEIRFRLNPSRVEVGEHRIGTVVPPRPHPAHRPGSAAWAGLRAAVRPGAVVSSPEYDLYYNEAMELRETMLSLRDRFRGLQEEELRPEEAPAAEAPAAGAAPAESGQEAAAPRFCPWCGAPVSPPGAAFCSSCGKELVS